MVSPASADRGRSTTFRVEHDFPNSVSFGDTGSNPSASPAVAQRQEVAVRQHALRECVPYFVKPVISSAARLLFRLFWKRQRDAHNVSRPSNSASLPRPAQLYDVSSVSNRQLCLSHSIVVAFRHLRRRRLVVSPSTNPPFLGSPLVLAPRTNRSHDEPEIPIERQIVDHVVRVGLDEVRHQNGRDHDSAAGIITPAD